MSHLPAFVLCLAGFAALALGTDRQQGAVFGRSLSGGATRGLRGAGTVALLLGLGYAVRWQGWGVGLVLFSGLATLAAGLVHCALIARARLGSRT